MVFTEHLFSFNFFILFVIIRSKYILHTHTQCIIACTYRRIHTRSCSGTQTEGLEEKQVFLNHIMLVRQSTLTCFAMCQCAIFSLGSNTCSVLLVGACSIAEATRTRLKHPGLGWPLAPYASQGFKEVGMSWLPGGPRWEDEGDLKPPLLNSLGPCTAQFQGYRRIPATNVAQA